MLLLAIPVLFSLIAEPVTGLVDTGFVSRLGEAPLAALGVGTSVLSLGFWVFNFLGISTHTGVAQALGRRDQTAGARITGLALIVAFTVGVLVLLIVWPLANRGAVLAGAQEPEVIENSVIYIRNRLFGAPAVIMLMVAFGARVFDVERRVNITEETERLQQSGDATLVRDCAVMVDWAMGEALAGAALWMGRPERPEIALNKDYFDESFTVSDIASLVMGVEAGFFADMLEARAVAVNGGLKLVGEEEFAERRQRADFAANDTIT